MTATKKINMTMTVLEAAEEAGVSESTIYMMAKENRLPGARRIGSKRIVIHREVFEEWLRTGKGR